MSLYPTPTRLALLREIDAENVTDGAEDDETYLIDPDPPYDSRKVTARVDEMQRAGWCDLDDRRPYLWVLTQPGRDVLAGTPAPAALPPGSRFGLGDRVAFHVYPGSRVAAVNAGGFRGEVIGAHEGYLLKVLADDGRICYATPDVVVPDVAPHCVGDRPIVCVCCSHPPVQLALWSVRT